MDNIVTISDPTDSNNPAFVEVGLKHFYDMDKKDLTVLLDVKSFERLKEELNHSDRYNGNFTVLLKSKRKDDLTNLYNFYSKLMTIGLSNYLNDFTVSLEGVNEDIRLVSLPEFDEKRILVFLHGRLQRMAETKDDYIVELRITGVGSASPDKKECIDAEIID